MEDNLGKLSRCLTEAGRIVSQITSGNSPAACESSNDTKNLVSNSNEASSSAISAVGLAVHRARSMINHSQLRGAYCRLNTRERLRATNTSTLPASKRVKRETEKAFEFVLLKFPEENDSYLDGEIWNLSDDYIVLRGFVNLKSEDNEEAVRKSLANAIQLKFPAVTGSDLEFIKANRRKLSKPVNCQEYSFQQIKLLAGQGCIYVKIKDGFDFLIVSDDKKDTENEDDDREFPRVPASESAYRPTQSAYQFVSSVPEETQGKAVEHDDVVAIDDVRACIRACKENDVDNPIEILKYAQKYILQGRPLDVSAPSQALEGDTNFISIDRYNVLNSAFEEIKALENLRFTLEVSFYGEMAQDSGGPRKEFFTLCLREIKEKYFDKGLRPLLADHYEDVGKIMCLSMLQNGSFPRFLTEALLQELFFEGHPSTCIANLRKGFASLGIYQIGRELPLFLHLMRPNDSTRLSRRKLVTLLCPSFSEEGSNARKHENDIYTLFSKYIRETASGRRAEMNLGHILQFSTGADEEPLLGFELKPTIYFTRATTNNKWAFVPTANTCSLTLYLPTGSHDIPVPTEEDLFEVYDYAFKNSYFGLV